MITAQEARELATQESRVQATIDSLDTLIRARAPASRTQKLTMMLDLGHPTDEPVVNAVLEKLREAKYTASAHRVYVELNNGNAEIPKMEFTISWGAQ